MPDIIQYTETAYTPNQKEQLSPPDPAAWAGSQRHYRAIPLANGIFCGDYRYHANASNIRSLKKGTMPVVTLDKIKVTYGKNPLVHIMALRTMAIVLTVAGVIPIFLCLVKGFTINLFVMTLFLGGGGSFLILHLLTKIIPDKNNIFLNRATGMVSFPKTGPYPEKEIPFAEFDAYYRSMAYPTGVIRYSLHIGHRYTPISFSIMNPTVDLLRVFSEWEQLQQFMDVSLPLPDIPELEPVRHLDPTTRAWDTEHGREPNYWKNFDLDKLDNEIMFSTRKLEAVDWHSLPTDHVPPEAKAKASSMAQLFKE